MPNNKVFENVRLIKDKRSRRLDSVKRAIKSFELSYRAIREQRKEWSKSSGDDVGEEEVFKLDNLIFQSKFLFFQTLYCHVINNRFLHDMA